MRPILRSRHFEKGCEISVISRGKTFKLSNRYAEGNNERLPSLVAELVQLKVDVLVSGGNVVAIRAAKQATETIPIVMVALQDPGGAESNANGTHR